MSQSPPVNTGDYQAWCQSVESFFRSRRPDVSIAQLDRNFVWACFVGGMAPIDFVMQTDLRFASPSEGTAVRLAPSQANHAPDASRTQSDDGLVWFLAFVPLLSAFAMIAAGFYIGLFLTILTNVTLCTIDASKLKSQGFHAPAAALAVILVPAYLLVRPSRVRGSYGYAVAWMICFTVSLFVPVPLPN